MDFLNYDDLKESWKAYRAAYWTTHSHQGESDTRVDWDKHEEDSLDACLIELRHRQMMFQGHQWTCGNCHHKNWVDFGALSPEFSCEICKQPTVAPIDIKWLFRPNEFLIESLRDHSVLSLIWVLSALSERSQHSFMFGQPTCFGFTRDETDPDAEADLLIFLDGKALFCEVKSSWRSLRLSHITDFVTLAKRLRPDTAMLAVMEGGTGPSAELEAAQAQLNAEGIEYALLTLDMYKLGDDPFLHLN